MSWRRPPQATVLLAVAAAYAVVSLFHARGFFHDDAYITFRFVDRLLAGKGLSWTDGPPVEGYTHPLWLAQLALIRAFEIDLEAASKLLGMAYLAAIVRLWWRTGAWGLPLWVFVALPGTAMWTLGGLEMMGYLAWLLLGGTLTVALCREPSADPDDRLAVPSDRRLELRLAVTAGLALAAATLHRPDGLVFCVLAPGVVAFGPRRRLAWPLAAASLLPVGAYLVFRLAYFGALQAAPAVAKIEGIPLRMQLESFGAYFLVSATQWLPGALAVAAALLWRTNRAAALMFGVALAALLPAVLGGGDHMLGARLFLPVTGLLCLAAGLRWARARPPLLLQLAVAAVAVGHAMHVVSPRVGRDPAAVWGRIMGELLAEHLPPGTLVAAATAGSTPYFSPDLDYIDTLGLNDRHIAERPVDVTLNEWQGMPGHRKGDGAYVLSRRPDVIVRGGAAGDNVIHFLTDHELDRTAMFKRDYQEFQFSAPAPYLRQLSEDQAPAEALRLGRARMTTWLRVGSDRVTRLRDQALKDPKPPKAGPGWHPAAPMPARPPQAKAPSRPLGVAAKGIRRASGLQAKTRCVRGQAEVEFAWRIPPDHAAQFLDIASMGSPDSVGFDVTDVGVYRKVLTSGVYEWRVSSKFAEWWVSKWQLLTVDACPPQSPPK